MFVACAICVSEKILLYPAAADRTIIRSVCVILEKAEMSAKASVHIKSIKIYMHMCECVRARLHVRVRARLRARVCMCACVRVCMCAFACACALTYALRYVLETLSYMCFGCVRECVLYCLLVLRVHE